MYWFLWIFVGFVAGWLRAGASKEKAMADSWTSRWDRWRSRWWISDAHSWVFRHRRNNSRELGSCRWCDGVHNGSRAFHR